MLSIVRQLGFLATSHSLQVTGQPGSPRRSASLAVAELQLWHQQGCHEQSQDKEHKQCRIEQCKIFSCRCAGKASMGCLTRWPLHQKALGKCTC